MMHDVVNLVHSLVVVVVVVAAAAAAAAAYISCSVVFRIPQSG